MTQSHNSPVPSPLNRVPPAPPPVPPAMPLPPRPGSLPVTSMSGDTTVVRNPTSSDRPPIPTTPTSSSNPRPTATATTPSAPPPLPGHRPGAPPPARGARNRAATGQLTLEMLVREAYEKGVSDIHLGVGEVPRFRQRGHMELTEHPETDEDTFFDWLREILTEDQIQQFKETLEYDGATQYDDMARVRINVFVSLKGPAMVLRLIPLTILTMEQLHLPEVFRELCHHHKGLILVTGPTGSGKSTTMAAMIDYINKEMPKHIISIEDPVEFVHQSRKSLIRQREVGLHTLKFDNALKASLREDPDIILIGEMRDRETVNTALKAAQTGHLVFGTLHTNSAVKTIERILNLYNPDEQAPMRIQVAESLVAVIAQSLVRTTDGKRAAIHEIMVNTDAIKDFIKRGEVDEIEGIIPRCTFDGMCSMNQSLYALYESGRITEETALEASPKPNEMAQTLRGRT
ncbi:type IV pilus twitching motility protein PilT [Leptolyngbya sp. FACHB-261]|uniref:type IV pilus twitching motility protein PilT n=1 Tax=Leptolyngbya sp. FACHB-261 TaxID=2692806 RepID=UPI001688C02D|nr:type IV pilus twitching motility protein PilT [Leptolyngbya sp. FACHB-261]MBD2104886.1 PilT/PilU family type 4a pilus ATPase [Leptolyngbya sp. FACHB-261]